MKCSRCGREYDWNSGAILCANRDYGRLDIQYDYEEIKEMLNREDLSRREKGVWKYRELLPVNDPAHVVTLGEGGSSLLPANRLKTKIGVREVWLLDDTRNPTGSFKDRPMTVGASKAVELGYKTVVSASSGNAAASLSAYAARAGLACIAFVPESASAGKLAQLTMYGATVVKVRGSESGEDPTVKMLLETCDRYNWYPCPSFGPMNPYQAEGPKTMAYEIAEGLHWKIPDWVFVPVGAGGALAGNWRGFKDFLHLDFIATEPRMVAVQPTGCAPVVRAYEDGVDAMKIGRWERPKSVAAGLLDPFPWDGDLALHAIRDSEGTAVAVSDEEVLEAQRLLAKREGIFAEPSGAASLAGLIALIKRGRVESSETVVVEITGGGLKDTNLTTQALPNVPTINPSLKEFEEILRLHEARTNLQDPCVP